MHDAYVRLVDVDKAQHWNSRGHFFAAAAEAIRRILIESARRQRRQKHGADFRRVDLEQVRSITNLPPDELLALSDAIDELAIHDRAAAELVKIRYFAGQSIAQAAETLGISRSAAYRHWTYAHAWLFAYLQDDGESCR